ncbi:MAG: NifU family protein [Hadesarchaea archaeon]|nr:MAG: NifU family protein [Hadesarchaea archaeon]
MKRRIEEVLNQLRPELQAHGGDVELVEVTEDKVVKVRLTGACAGCPMSALTLAMGVERALKREIPEIKGVVAVP